MHFVILTVSLKSVFPSAEWKLRDILNFSTQILLLPFLTEIMCLWRLEEVTIDATKYKTLSLGCRQMLQKHEEENTLFKKIVDKFYEFKQQSSFKYMYEISIYLDKCSNILDDPEEAWSFNAHREAATTESIKSSDIFIKNEISRLRQYQYKQREFVVNLLDEGTSFLMTIGNAIEQKFAPTMLNEKKKSSLLDLNNSNVEDVHMRIQALLFIDRKNIGTRNSAAVAVVDTSKVLSQALQEKVSALMLLHQQEERHFLERNENVVLLQ